jgi:D-alanine-D-alanine ligase
MKSTRVLILYNEPVLPPSHPDAESEHEIYFTVDEVEKVLVAAGFNVSRLGASREPAKMAAALEKKKADVVFNLFEGTADQPGTEAVVAGLLEWLQIPFTGSPSQCLCLSRTKHITKTLLQGAGLPTAEFFVVEQGPVLTCPIPWPVIVKPAGQDASVGLDQGSVVCDLESLNARVELLIKNYGGPILVEQFIRGREFNVAVIENPTVQILPISEIRFIDKDPNFWPIVTYDAKWAPGTRDYDSTPPDYPARVSPRLKERVENLAREAFLLMGCRDYARVDFRVKPNGKPYILEVNPNPDFSPNAGLSGGLNSAGSSHAQFTLALVNRALTRGGREPIPTAATVSV